VGKERGEPPSPELPSGTSGESVRDRLTDARESIASSALDLLERFERDEIEALERVQVRLEAVMAKRLDAAEAHLSDRFGGMAQEVREASGARLAAGLEEVRARLESEGEERAGALESRIRVALGTAVAELKESAGSEPTRDVVDEQPAAADPADVEAVQSAVLERIATAEARLGEENAGRLEAESASLRADAERSLSAVREAEARVVKRLEAAGEKLSRRSRRHELKLARQESSKRVDAALERVEKRAATLQDQLARSAREQHAGVEAATSAKRPDLDERLSAAFARLEAGTERAERALAEVAESERRMFAIQGNVVAVGRQIAVAAGAAQSAADFERRLESAAAAEEEAARRVRDAERRLRERLAR
jgi:hypothetical protein